jgi:DNA repair photolyase
MIVKEIQSKTILSRSQVYPYVVNPYTGCQFACSYCYARFMKRFTGHREPWGEFVDVKVNAPDLLRREIARKSPGRVWVSGVCDPYQPLEAKYRLTRQCLDILVQNGWPVAVQTKSPLVLRDMDILTQAPKVENVDAVEVGFSLATADDSMRQLFEPHAPRIEDRVKALAELHRAGIRTYVMVAPMLPGAEGLPEMLGATAGSVIVDRVIIDRMNYHHADWVYRQNGLDDKNSDEFFDRTRQALAAGFATMGVRC